MNKWSEIFDIPFPECRKCGVCCKCASPSASCLKLLEKAASGEEFARDFFSIFVPHSSIEETKAIYPTIVERSIKALRKRINENNTDESALTFYRCRYYSEDNECLIYEDRPELCREFPSSPFAILEENCAFYNWSQECREKYKVLMNELDKLKKMKKELADLKYQQKAIALNRQIKKVPDEYKFMWLCSSMSLVSPGKSWMKMFYAASNK